jgi:hypothetical protein
MKDRTALYSLCMLRARPMYVAGARLISFIEEWQRCVSDYGRAVNVEEFIAWNGERRRRTTFDRLRLFRDTFPELGEQGLPSDLMGPLLQRLVKEADRSTVAE